MPPLTWGQVHTILQKYAELAASPHGKLVWQEIGGGLRKDLSLSECWRITVACKLEHCPKAPVDPCRAASERFPVVEMVLYGEAAAAELRNRIEQEERLVRRGREHFAWIKPQVILDRQQLDRIQRNLYRLRCLSDERGNLYERGMEYLARAFGACYDQDPSFRSFVEEARP